jgi:3-deoxy-D-manno-octulosonic-acid transferase
MGEMPAYYACAHAALLGGSFAPLGGQNLIEAAACGCPVFLGPHTFNFAQAAEGAIAAGAAWRCPDLHTAVALACVLAECGEGRAEASEAARAYAGQDQGAALRMVDAMQPLLISPTAAR